jgi:CBS domain-containing protein
MNVSIVTSPRPLTDEERRAYMKNLKACDVMVRPVVSAKKSASARDVALQLLNGLYSGMPVTDGEGRVVGIITELDLLNAVMHGKELVKTTAEEIMTRDPTTVDLDTPLDEVVSIMKEQGIIRLPITAEGRLVGVIARCDVLKSLIEPEFVSYM